MRKIRKFHYNVSCLPDSGMVKTLGPFRVNKDFEGHVLYPVANSNTTVSVTGL